VWGWTSDGALTRFADAAVRAALSVVAGRGAAGRLVPPIDASAGAFPATSACAGKHGAFELNYSSDIDITVFYEPERLPVRGVDPRPWRCG